MEFGMTLVCNWDKETKVKDQGLKSLLPCTYCHKNIFDEVKSLASKSRSKITMFLMFIQRGYMLATSSS